MNNEELAGLFCQTQSGYGIILTDSNGAVVSINDAARSLYKGFEAEMTAGILETQGLSTRTLREGVWIEESTTKLLRGDGSIAGYSRVARDASEVKKLEKQAERANEELHQFVFTVSHDLQEPLRTARSYSELLSRRYKAQLDSDAGEFIDFIVDAATRMSQLLRDLLAFSQAGRPDRTKPERTDATSILQWTLMNLSKDIGSSGAKITHGPLPIVFVDQAQLDAVFQHLISNSIKFRGDVPPEISIEAEEVGEGMWQFSVKDNGPGIDPQQLERIFGLFKRLVAKSVPGTGVGLSISRKIVEAHGGKIWMESAPGEGSTVKFTLPAHA